MNNELTAITLHGVLPGGICFGRLVLNGGLQMNIRKSIEADENSA